MGVASSNRGDRVLARQADERMPAANARSDRAAQQDEIERLRAEVARLERDMARARRCLAAERCAREQGRLRLADSERAYGFAVPILCRIAFHEVVPAVEP